MALTRAPFHSVPSLLEVDHCYDATLKTYIPTSAKFENVCDAWCDGDGLQIHRISHRSTQFYLTRARLNLNRSTFFFQYPPSRSRPSEHLSLPLQSLETFATLDQYMVCKFTDYHTESCVFNLTQNARFEIPGGIEFFSTSFAKKKMHRIFFLKSGIYFA